jgi:hypothetical protein
MGHDRDRRQAQRLEAVSDQPRGRFGRIALPPVLCGETIADLGLLRIAAVRNEPDIAERIAFLGSVEHRPVAESAPGMQETACRDAFAAHRRVADRRDMAHHQRVGVERGDEVEIGLGPRFEEQALAFQHRQHGRRPVASFGDCTRLHWCGSARHPISCPLSLGNALGDSE